MHIPNSIPGLLCALIASALPCGLFAQGGPLDVTFDGDGKLIQDFMGTSDAAEDLALQADGKIVSVGHVIASGGNADFAVMRHFPDGSLDPSFDVDGQVATDMLGGDMATSVAIQSDGRIVVAGYVHRPDGNMSSLVARYLTDGTIDPSFNGVGWVAIDYTGGISYESAANAVAIQPDGKILVAGGSAGNFALARLHTDGSLDNSFAFDGKVTMDLGPTEGACMELALQPDGRIVVSGFAYDGQEDDAAVARFNTDGTLDTSFDVDGKVITNMGVGGYVPQGMALAPDGRIVVAGSQEGSFLLMRYNTDGTLDTSFDLDGRVLTILSSIWAQAFSVALQPDGKIVAVGYANSGVDYDFAVVRYNANGSLDNTFDLDGKVLTDMSVNDEGHAVVIQPDGKILVAGQSYSGNGTYPDFTFLRYLSDLNVGLIDLSGHDRSVLVYPNPVEDEAVLQYALSKEETISVRLLDLEGRVLHTFIENRVQNAGSHQQRIALPQGLASGAYMLSVSSLTGQVSIRIVR